MLPLLILLLATPLAAEINPRFWSSYFGDHRLTKHWGVHFDGQYRHDLTQDWGQLLLRPGLNYYIRPNLFLTQGYLYVRTESKNTVTPEHRSWQQIQYTPKVLNLNMSHRLRLEQRWISIPTGHRYQNRIRYFYRTEVPATGKYFVGLQNEIFLGFGPNKGASVYDQNRAYISVGRRFGPIGRLETGYMYQNTLLRNGITREHNHILVVSFLSAFTRVK
ncbi:MAG: DUF2490 domain-containing protein [Acidobacteria bacterium]|nr:DUF2490 domain-containing protein [Acidobacteriota bacterium]